MESGTCQSCGAGIAWVTTVTGARMPLDPDPSPDGNVSVGADGLARVTGRLDEPDGTPLYKSHFASCPFAARHRRKS